MHGAIICPSCRQTITVPQPAKPTSAKRPDIWPANAGTAYTIVGGLLLAIGVLLCLGGIPSYQEMNVGKLAAAICGAVFVVGGLLVMGVGSIVGYISRLGILIEKLREDKST